MKPTVLTEHEIRDQLHSIPGWTQSRKEISRTFELKDFVSAIGFVTSVAILAERADHHPDIDIRWNRVTLTLSTHSADGLTIKDFDLARSVNAL
ncbi:MAG: hypothetical protein A3H45_05815 [Ignavibacteria bacterium RIFCSPLOWO2_02_FULL_55_14]|nr:MAG: hypothetical protein A2X68_09140 [Ignavibacteria bacterium GWC2_56_12]OGU62279.1 MAG: hypothetical protein A3C56_04850 [Ignavibacteria bacterium RIFCSPHIGHO2_02_FULL_56_12]OGU75739.1 MAG: hypothetical protein A3H45_05815 [Ignavibacteria bacterium RIFCSPLOWO2_02_FULL_55_14]HAV23164.1 4a-hydroxytetrahydrobiopterin dehydratase [Bacteroidota bacterium]